MNKKDRIAVVLSVPVLMLVVLNLFGGGRDGPAIGAFFFIPLLCYWGYRFIQNDISFLKVKDD